MGALAALALASCLGACQTGRMHQGTVELPGPGPIPERLARAKEIATRVWDDGKLRDRLRQRFPTIQEGDLVGMFLHWAEVTMQGRTEKTVVIQIGVREKDGRVPAAEAVEHVRQLCLAELERAPGAPAP